MGLNIDKSIDRFRQTRMEDISAAKNEKQLEMGFKYLKTGNTWWLKNTNYDEWIRQNTPWNPMGGKG